MMWHVSEALLIIFRMSILIGGFIAFLWIIHDTYSRFFKIKSDYQQGLKENKSADSLINEILMPAVWKTIITISIMIIVLYGFNIFVAHGHKTLISREYAVPKPWTMLKSNEKGIITKENLTNK